MIHDPRARAEGVRQVYTDLNRKYEEEETQRKAKLAKIAYINLYGFPVDVQALSLLPKTLAETYQAVVFFREGRKLKLGITDYANLNPVLKALADESYQVETYLISQSSFKHFLVNYDKVPEAAHTSNAIKLTSSDPRFGLKALASFVLNPSSATELLDGVLGAALLTDASDIHLEPSKENLKVRFRLDGLLQDTLSISMKFHHELISRIKILAKLKLNVISTPQDGSFSLSFDDQPVDIRVSVLPSAFGESFVLRILRQNKGLLEFEKLGIMGLARKQVEDQLQKPNGMILTTGPTGSGKTTTLYSIINKLNTPGTKIVTIEDPVEYKIEGITQTPIDSRSGMTFGSALRSILRQDPDIIMVGEMRDLETAETACQAALTGHIVLSTLHTNDAAGAIPRLMDLGVKPFVVAPAINAVIAQRLVRRLCEQCKQAYQLPENLQARVEMILKQISKASEAEVPKVLKFYHSVGCEVCHGSGYQGRMGVYEVFVVDESIEKLISQNVTTSEIKQQAIANGMLTMAQDGILKALNGLTDVEEVFRVTEG